MKGSCIMLMFEGVMYNADGTSSLTLIVLSHGYSEHMLILSYLPESHSQVMARMIRRKTELIMSTGGGDWEGAGGKKRVQNTHLH